MKLHFHTFTSSQISSSHIFVTRNTTFLTDFVTFYNYSLFGLFKTKRGHKIDPQSWLGSQPNIGELYRDEKKVITGPNGDTIGLVCQDLYLSLFNSEMMMEILCDELEISKDQYKNMVEKDFVEELKRTRPSSNLIRFWTQKINNDNV